MFNIIKSKTLYELMNTNTCVTFSLDFYYSDTPLISLSCQYVFLIHITLSNRM